MIKKEKTLSLYLAPWQKRMMKDFMSKSSLRGKSIKDIKKLVIKPIIGKCPMSYKIAMKGIRIDDWILYLTDEQMIIIGDFLGSRIPISSINISPEFIKAGDIAFY
jgi:hypothetical protein